MDHLPSHLRLSKRGVYYFRSAIPKRYQGALKRTEIRRSLGTRNRDAASAKSILFREALKTTIQNIDLMMRTLQKDNIDQVIYEYFEHLLNFFNRFEFPPELFNRSFRGLLRKIYNYFLTRNNNDCLAILSRVAAAV